MIRLARKILTWFLLTVVLAIGIAVAAEWFIEVLKQKRFYDDAAARWDAFAGQSAEVARSMWILLPTTYLAGLVTGLWIEAWSKKRRLARDEATVSVQEAQEAYRRDARKDMAGLMDQAIDSADLALREGSVAAYQHALPGLESTLMTIAKFFSIATPALRGDHIGPREAIRRGVDFLVEMRPLLNAGHVVEARQRAEALLRPPGEA